MLEGHFFDLLICWSRKRKKVLATSIFWCLTVFIVQNKMNSPSFDDNNYSYINIITSVNA